MSYLINTNVPVGSALNRLGSLIDVEINNPLGKDVLSYDSATQTWVNDDSIGNIVSMTQAQYDQLPTAEKQDPKKYYYITDTTISGAPIDDDAVSTSKTWSSDKINSKITANVVNSTYIDISGYDVNNKFECPCDGYVQIGANNNTSRYEAVIEGGIALYVNGGYNSTWNITATFVRKGMKVYATNKIGSGQMRFFKLENAV